MNPRVVAAVLFGLAVAVHFLIGAPAREGLDSANGDRARVRAESADARHRLEALDRRAEVLARAGFIEVSEGGRGRAEAVQAVRSAVIKALQQAGIEHVRLEVKPAAEPALAGVSLSAQGSFSALVRLTALLARPGSGLVLRKVTLNWANGLTMSLEAAALGKAS